MNVTDNLNKLITNLYKLYRLSNHNGRPNKYLQEAPLPRRAQRVGRA